MHAVLFTSWLHVRASRHVPCLYIIWPNKESESESESFLHSQQLGSKLTPQMILSFLHGRRCSVLKTGNLPLPSRTIVLYSIRRNVLSTCRHMEFKFGSNVLRPSQSAFKHRTLERVRRLKVRNLHWLTTAADDSTSASCSVWLKGKAADYPYELSTPSCWLSSVDSSLDRN